MYLLYYTIYKKLQLIEINLVIYGKFAVSSLIKMLCNNNF